VVFISTYGGKKIEMITTVDEIDSSLWFEKSTKPTVGSPKDDLKMAQYSIHKVNWKRSTCNVLYHIESLIQDSIECAIPEYETLHDQ